MRRLCHIANITTIHISREDRRRMIIEDIAIGSGLPVLEIILCTLSEHTCVALELTFRRLVHSGSPFRHFRRRWLLASDPEYGPFVVPL